MPATPTPIFQIPGPDLDDGPADVEAAFDPLRNRIEAILSTLAAVEIGCELMYCGTVLPDPLGDVEFAWADGSLIRRDIYTEFATRVGDAYNGGVAPGSGTPGQGTTGIGPLIRLPDKRGRVSVGADNFGPMGVAGRLTTNAVSSKSHPSQLGQSGGFERHTILGTEAAVKAHAVTVTVTDPGHRHDNMSLRGNQGPGSTLFVAGTFLSQVLGTPYVPDIPLKTTGISASGAAAAADAATDHNNVQPYEADLVIVRIK